ncbi:MAG: hypothetical protein JSR62_00145 [Nitrospira sp.]|nr:hypothetical protein [Nitrospira sp.]
MNGTRPVIVLLIALTALEGTIFLSESQAQLPSSTIRDGVLVGFLFGVPTLLIGGLIAVRTPWIAMATVIYSTIALALDLATIVQEASQASPRGITLALTAGSSIVNFLIVIFGGRCALAFQPSQPAPEGRPPTNFQSPSV